MLAQNSTVKSGRGSSVIRDTPIARTAGMQPTCLGSMAWTLVLGNIHRMSLFVLGVILHTLCWAILSCGWWRVRYRLIGCLGSNVAAGCVIALVMRWRMNCMSCSIALS